ncbi:11851_t:CDS:1 [Funneliformis geosporum]|uniref:14716_t:CDS:1 n=1 Tax=Funneliformis geosporum TaxID=1117311 RepID=A0A9W4SFQ8_9GLOM|nr:14716_t:CDS:1 [Funneliformis geosporum]CAI2170021.1 11851_t:CDS:1 [Funneliformis geosporum]
MTGRKRNIDDSDISTKSRSKLLKTTRYDKSKISTSTIKNSQKNVQILNVNRSDYLSYDDVKLMRRKINELATMNCEDEKSLIDTIDITDITSNTTEYLKDFKEKFSGVISIVTLLCTINKLFEDIGWKFSNFNELDGGKCELTDLITKKTFRLNVIFDEGYESDIIKHRMRKESEEQKYFYVYDHGETKLLKNNNDNISMNVKGKTNMDGVKIINGSHDDNSCDVLQTYSAARSRIKRNLPVSRGIDIILDKVTDEIRNSVVHFDNPFSLLEEKSQESNDGSNQEHLMREYEEIEKNSHYFVLIGKVNDDSDGNKNNVTKSKDTNMENLINIIDKSATHAQVSTNG